MNGELRDLYQDLVLDHGKSPRNFRVLEGATASAQGVNPLCGDQLTVYLAVAGDRITDVSFQGQGCAISKASASMMTQAVKAKSRAEAERLFEQVHQLVTGGPAGIDLEALGKLAALSGVSDFPARVKCASLAWHALHAALEGKELTVSTE